MQLIPKRLAKIIRFQMDEHYPRDRGLRAMKTASCLYLICCYVVGAQSLANSSFVTAKSNPAANAPTYTPLTQVIGSIDATINAKTDSYEWRVEPGVSLSSVLFVFVALNINTAELFIYDKDVQNPIFSCVACGKLLPPPFKSNTGSVRIVVKGVNGASFTSSSCKLQYVGQLMSVADASEQNVNTDLTLNMGYGTIAPVLIQNMIPRSVMQWRINLAKPMTFAFTTFQLHTSCAATLTIYDGPTTSSNILFSACSNANTPRYWINSTSSQTLVVLSSTASTSSSFSLEYFSDTELYHCGALLLPNVLTAPSMAIFDGSAVINEMRRSEACEWSVYGTAAMPAVLLFKWVSLKHGGSVQVYDKNKQGVLLWDSGAKGTKIVPPPLQSLSGPLYVVYASNTQLPYKAAGFYAEYFTRGIEYGIGTKQEIYSMSSALAISLPAVSYPSSFSYSWLLQPLASTGPLILFVNHISLNEELRIFDAGTGSLVTKVVGNSPPTHWIYSPSGRALLSFSGNNNSGSFDIDYYSDGSNYHCGFPVNPAKIRSRSRILTDGSKSNEEIFANQNCEWLIQPPEASGLFIYFTRMSIFNADITFFDVRGNILSYITNTDAIPAPIQLFHDDEVRVKYTTTVAATGTGFSMTYYSINDIYNGPGDGTIVLNAASMLSLSLPDPATNYSWYIKPKQVSQITVVFSALDIDCYTSSLAIYSGSSVSPSFLLGEYCGDKVPSNWLHFPSADITIVYTTVSSSTKNFFDLSYFADAAAYHCGIATVAPGVLTAPSMRISDGSVSFSPMAVNDTCEWIISPRDADRVVLEFTKNSLLGAKMWIYDGEDNMGALLWYCDGCIVIPPPLISASNSMYVKYISPMMESSGTGFAASYWSIYDSSAPTTTLLESPQQYNMNNFIHRNLSLGWQLGLTTALSKLQLQSLKTGSETSMSFTDGRQLPRDYYKSTDTLNHCGFVTSAVTSHLLDSMFSLAAMQSSQYILSNSSKKQLISIGEASNPNGFLLQPKICKYVIHNTEEISRSVELVITRYDGNSNSRLTVYTGEYGYESILLDLTSSTRLKNKKLIFPCGKGALLLENNSTENILEFTYRIVDSDKGKTCVKYGKSLLHDTPNENEFAKYQIYVGIFFILLVAGCCSFICRRNLVKLFTKRRKYVKATSLHPPFSPKLDKIRNKFLFSGTCCICKDHCKVLKMACSHIICPEDLQGYIAAALGDISMFPLKCPMFHMGCTGFIETKTAKRVMTATQYERFCDFSDRALYGEGMRCLFCNNYVCYPANENISMVECPYCIQRFCVKCKRPWHYGKGCPLDTVDDDLEKWKRHSGAQKCPTCSKLIEKDDPNTCNHMVHKITDGIPCLRERTDFCYLCGMEVAADYPHDEIRTPGVNHFPDGVFQKCRTILQREIEADREKYRRTRRMKRSPARGHRVAIVDDISETDADTVSTPGSRVEDAWDMTLRGGFTTSLAPFDEY